MRQELNYFVMAPRPFPDADMAVAAFRFRSDAEDCLAREHKMFFRSDYYLLEKIHTVDVG